MKYADDIQKAVDLPLEDKVEFSKSLIREWYNHWDGNVFVAFSGGKDSTVLLHLVRSMYPDVKAIFSNTGLEYPEIMEFAKSHDNVEIVQPRKKFIRVLEEDGFPVSNKKVAGLIRPLQNPTPRNFSWRRLGITGYVTSKDKFVMGSKIPTKWMPLAFSDVRVTNLCCDYLKKDPMKDWLKENKKMKPIIGMMLGEGDMRDLKMIKRSCNMFSSDKPSSVPLKFWTDKDVYEYAEKYGVDICRVYKEQNINRTGCTFCGYGADLEPAQDNRFTKLKKSHPKQFNIFVHKFGMNKALDYAGINYGEEPTFSKPEMPTYECSSCGETHPMNEVGFITEREWTDEEQIEKPPTAGMDLFCDKCAMTHGMPVDGKELNLKNI